MGTIPLLFDVIKIFSAEAERSRCSFAKAKVKRQK